MVDALSTLADDKFIPLSDANTIHLVRRGQQGTCAVSGGEIEREDHHIAIDFPIRTIAVGSLAYALLQISSVDRFASILRRVSRDNSDALDAFDDDYTVSIAPVEDIRSVTEYICPVCMDVCDVGSQQVRWEREASRDVGYCHVECTDKLATIVEGTWEHTDDVLTEAL